MKLKMLVTHYKQVTKKLRMILKWSLKYNILNHQRQEIMEEIERNTFKNEVNKEFENKITHLKQLEANKYVVLQGEKVKELINSNSEKIRL